MLSEPSPAEMAFCSARLSFRTSMPSSCRPRRYKAYPWNPLLHAASCGNSYSRQRAIEFFANGEGFGGFATIKVNAMNDDKSECNHGRHSLRPCDGKRLGGALYRAIGIAERPERTCGHGAPKHARVLPIGCGVDAAFRWIVQFAASFEQAARLDHVADELPDHTGKMIGGHEVGLDAGAFGLPHQFITAVAALNQVSSNEKEEGCCPEHGNEFRRVIHLLA